MNVKEQKRHPRHPDQAMAEEARKDQADGQGEGTLDPFEATSPQPKDTPVRKAPPAPDNEQEERSNLADIGEADEQVGTVDGMKQGSAHQDPPATLPQHLRHERRKNL